jgi:ankyrin repeat protein
MNMMKLYVYFLSQLLVLTLCCQGNPLLPPIIEQPTRNENTNSQVNPVPSMPNPAGGPNVKDPKLDRYEIALFAALHTFAERGETEHLRAMLEKHPNWVNLHMNDVLRRKPQSGDSMTLLHRATANQHVGTVQLLLDSKADCKLTDESGRTAFHVAVATGNVALTKLFFEKRAETDLNACVKTEYSPFHTAVATGNLELVKLLIQHGADLNLPTPARPPQPVPELPSSPFGSSDMVKAPIRLTEAVPAYTPLNIAVKFKHDEVVKYLKSLGGKVSEK